MNLSTNAVITNVHGPLQPVQEMLEGIGESECCREGIFYVKVHSSEKPLSFSQPASARTQMVGEISLWIKGRSLPEQLSLRVAERTIRPATKRTNIIVYVHLLCSINNDDIATQDGTHRTMSNTILHIVNHHIKCRNTVAIATSLWSDLIVSSKCFGDLGRGVWSY